MISYYKIHVLDPYMGSTCVLAVVKCMEGGHVKGHYSAMAPDPNSAWLSGKSPLFGACTVPVDSKSPCVHQG